MLQAFIMLLREGFEAFLIVAIILSYLKATGAKWLVSSVYLGIFFSILASTGLGLLLMKGINHSLWEAIFGVVTIFLVGSLVAYMWKTSYRLKHQIHRQLLRVSSQGSRAAVYFGVFLFTVFMITREGMETALMLLQVRDEGVLMGIFMGLGASAFLAWLWARYSRLINVKRFFQVTGIYLILFMVQVAIYSAHEFSESGLLPGLEAFHAASEPFSPVGIYGQWFSVLAIVACLLWLAGAGIADRFQKRAYARQIGNIHQTT